MPTFASIIIFSYFATLIFLTVVAGLFLIFKYNTVLGIKSEYNVNLPVEENDHLR